MNKISIWTLKISIVAFLICIIGAIPHSGQLPISGLSYFILFKLGERMWPGIALGTFILEMSQFHSWSEVLLHSTLSTLQPLFGLFIFKKLLQKRSLCSHIDLFAHLYAALIPSGLCAFLSTLFSMGLTKAFYQAWAAHTFAIIAIFPTLLEMSEVNINRLISLGMKNLTSSTALLFLNSFITTFIYTSENGSHFISLILLPLTIAGLYLDKVTLSFATFSTCLISVGYTLLGRGPFAHFTFDQSLIRLHIFLSLICIASLALKSLNFNFENAQIYRIREHRNKIAA